MQKLCKDRQCQGYVQIPQLMLVERLFHKLPDIILHLYDVCRTLQNRLENLFGFQF